MGQPETVYTGPQRLECGPRKGWPHWLAARKPGRGEHRVPPPTAAAAMAAAAAATARSSVAPHASPTLRRSGSSGDRQWIAALPESSFKDITVSLNAYRNCRFGLFASTAKAVRHIQFRLVTLMKEQEEEKEVSVADRDSSNPGRHLHAHFTQKSTLQTAPCAAAASSRPAASLVRFFHLVQFHRVQFTELSTATSVQALFRRLIGPLTDVLAC
uniref:Uncharacterized protein n=1 Tax=Oryza nivara TaxID=4536 RepID=A0A0E0IC67_ORYNI